MSTVVYVSMSLVLLLLIALGIESYYLYESMNNPKCPAATPQPCDSSTCPACQNPFPDGMSVGCQSDKGFKKYRYDKASNTIQYYPSSTIAQSWDPNWQDAVILDCTKFSFKQGEHLGMKPSS